MEDISDEILSEILKRARDNQCDMWRPEGRELPDVIEQIIDDTVWLCETLIAQRRRQPTERS